MKLLFDHNLSPRLVSLLVDIYPDSNHLYLLGLDQDSDFNELLILKGFPPKVIWIRLGNCSTKTIESLLRDNYEAILSFEGDQNLGIIALS
jgi:predicted nuclease of predicted toxin-antitoxin system